MTKSNRWWDAALCANVRPEVFQPKTHSANRPQHIETAKFICYRCPVRDRCLAAAMKEEKGLDRRARAGIRAALTPTERWELEHRKETA